MVWITLIALDLWIISAHSHTLRSTKSFGRLKSAKLYWLSCNTLFTICALSFQSLLIRLLISLYSHGLPLIIMSGAPVPVCLFSWSLRNPNLPRFSIVTDYTRSGLKIISVRLLLVVKYRNYDSSSCWKIHFTMEIIVHTICYKPII